MPELPEVETTARSLRLRLIGLRLRHAGSVDWPRMLPQTTAEDIDWFIPHQANKRIIDASAHKLHIAPQKVVLTVDLHGNTSAASIPLALSVAVRDGRVKKGDLVLFEAMGGGFTWGSALVRW